MPDPLLSPSPLDAAKKARLDQIQRMLTNIADPALAARAARHGYDNAEHRLGWALWAKAAGVDRPLDHFLAQADVLALASAPSAVKARFRFLDGIENKWLPRTRNAIRRFVSHDRRDAVEAAFFADLEQQPLGPSVVASVERFLVRLAELERSAVPGAKEAVESLRKKGLTDELREEIAAAIAEAKRATLEPRPAPPSAEAIAAASRAQLEAFERLEEWYRDWADTLRDELGYHDAVRLGILSPRGGRRAKRSEEDEGGGD